MRFRYALLSIALLLPVIAAAQPGTLDPAFGQDGLVTTSVGGSDYQAATTIAVQPDGRIVTAGHTDSYSNCGRAFLARHLPSGEPDASFGDGGLVLLDQEHGCDVDVTALALQPDGRPLVLSYQYGNVLLHRFLPDGAPDASFGEGGSAGVVVSQYGADIALQPDGKIVVAGSSFESDAVVARYHGDGKPDLEFGQEGVTTVSVSPVSRARAVEVTPDGRIAVVGSIRPESDYDFLAFRLLEDGSLDPGFGTGGVVTTAFSDGHDHLVDVTLYPDGSIVATGTAGTDVALVRYAPDGTLDPSFGEGGVVTTSLSQSAFARTIALDGDAILVAGYSFLDPDGSHFVLARYTADGGLDPAFGDGGLVTEPSSTSYGAVAYDLTLDGEGRVLAGGVVDYQAAIVRYIPDGSFDSSFGDGGLVLTSGIAPGLAGVRDAVVQPDGKIIVAGYAEEAPEMRCALIRYEPDGALDPTFGDGGVVMEEACASAWNAVVLAEDGALYAVEGGRRSRFRVARFDTSGERDPSFGEGGFATLDVSGAEAQDVLLQDDGRIVVIGEANHQFGLARFLPDGSPDPDFGEGGLVVTSIGTEGAYPYAAALTGDGLILAGGSATPPATGTSSFALVRYLPDGELDASFGDDGVAYTSFEQRAYLRALVLQEDGRFVVGGYTWSDPRVVVARYLPDGALDPTFAGGGHRRLYMARNPDNRLALALQPDGKILGAGSTPGSGGRDFRVVRLDTDGSLDDPFGSAGYATAAFGEDDSGAAALVLQGEERVVAVGVARPTLEFGQILGSDIALAGFFLDASTSASPPGPAAPDEVFTLSATYPNPASGDAVAVLEVARTQPVSAVLFDALGKRVATVHEGTVAAGVPLRLRVAGEGLAAGTYVLRVEGSDFTTSRRLTLLR